MKTQTQYLKEAGSKCPKCSSTDVEATPLEADGNAAWSDVTCLHCGYEYSDEFTLSGYAPRGLT